MANCIRCGKVCADNETMCPECKAWFEEKTKGNGISGASAAKAGKQNPVKENNAKEKKVKEKPIKEKREKKEIQVDKKVLVIAGVLILLLIVGGVLFATLGRGNFVTENAQNDQEVAEDATGDGYIENDYPPEDVPEEMPEEEIPVYDSTEGGIHQYTYLLDDCTWTEAFYKAQEAGGYLARINSLEEFNYIAEQLEDMGYEEKQFRIGGRRDKDSMEYYWVDEYNVLYGDQINTSVYWCTDKWMQNEPSFVDGEIDECYLDIFYYEGEGRWVMNDVPNDIISIVPYYSGKIGYIIEYEN